MTLYYLITTPPGPAKTITALIFVLLLLCLLLFWSLTVEIKSDHIHVYFGFGFIHKRILYSDIKQVNVVRTPWYYGWGIRPALHGWMFKDSGFGAVELIFQNNERFRIGSDQPNQLHVAIQHKLSERGSRWQKRTITIILPKRSSNSYIAYQSIFTNGD